MAAPGHVVSRPALKKIFEKYIFFFFNETFFTDDYLGVVEYREKKKLIFIIVYEIQMSTHIEY